MKCNEGPADRVVRSVGGIFLLGTGLAFFPILQHPAFAVALVVGAVGAVTGILGFCPLYGVLGITTDQGHGGAAPSA